MPRLIQPLPEGPVDIVGDIHGELGALQRLLWRLGADPDRGTTARPLVFVGDLIDRGPDSPGVVELVMRLVERAGAAMVLGNHELNLMLGLAKEGNGWARGDPTDAHQRLEAGQAVRTAFPSRQASAAQVERFLAFFAEQPLALERADLRVVHACWSPEAIDQLPEEGDVVALHRAWSRRIHAELDRGGWIEREREERAAHAHLCDLTVRPDRPLPAHTHAASLRQSTHPVKALTSGLERPVPFSRIFFVGGKWRFVRRHDWWNHYDGDAAVVVGHYWRRRAEAEVSGKPDTWQTPGPYDWTGPRGTVFCVDYSVGRRFVERQRGVDEGFDGGLAALRWPERALVFDDRGAPIATAGWRESMG